MRDFITENHLSVILKIERSCPLRSTVTLTGKEFLDCLGVDDVMAVDVIPNVHELVFQFSGLEAVG